LGKAAGLALASHTRRRRAQSMCCQLGLQHATRADQANLRGLPTCTATCADKHHCVGHKPRATNTCSCHAT
jgi:hypothetical protein